MYKGDRMPSDETAKSQPFTPQEHERIRAHIRARGITFEVFLPEAIANWLREKLAAGVFKDPGEAAFVAFQDMRELDRHPSIRQELLKAMIDARAADPAQGVSMEELCAKYRAQMREYANTEPPNDSE
jgi:antitoxin ParD1/3/4